MLIYHHLIATPRPTVSCSRVSCSGMSCTSYYSPTFELPDLTSHFLFWLPPPLISCSGRTCASLAPALLGGPCAGTWTCGSPAARLRAARNRQETDRNSLINRQNARFGRQTRPRSCSEQERVAVHQRHCMHRTQSLIQTASQPCRITNCSGISRILIRTHASA